MHNHHQTSQPHKRWNNPPESLLLPLAVYYSQLLPSRRRCERRDARRRKISKQDKLYGRKKEDLNEKKRQVWLEYLVSAACYACTCLYLRHYHLRAAQYKPLPQVKEHSRTALQRFKR